MQIAITREISPNINRCELTYLDRRPIDLEAAIRQHALYEECLAALGCTVHRLPAEPGLPDSVFVEDAAIVLDELAVISRPGAESRRPEIHAVARALARYRRLVFIEPPGTLEGGDVLRLGKSLYVGLSRRSNRAAIDQLRLHAREFGYTVTGVPVHGVLHLKSAATPVAKDTVLINRERFDADVFEQCRLIDVDPSEPSAANALLVGEAVIFHSGFPATRKRMEASGIDVRSIDMSELAKAEGGVTCCSLIVDV
jgi:dimethylargininase